MAITLQGIRLKSVDMGFDDSGTMKLGGSYELISSTGVVLAKNNFNGYSDIKVGLSPALAAELDHLLSGIKTELNKVLGLE